MQKIIVKGQRGFTLIELLAVIAILSVLAGLVAGTIIGLGSRSQQTRLDGDRDTMKKAANRFFLESFPQRYPVTSLSLTDAAIQVTPDLGVRLIDFRAPLPQDPNKKFVPDFLSELPDSAALVSWRVDTNSGNTFFASDGAVLIRPSNNRLDVSAASGAASARADHILELSMSKNEAAFKSLKVSVPAGYSLGGQFASANTLVGVLNAKVDTDNEKDAGRVIRYGGVLVSTSKANEWKLVVNYNDNVSDSGTGITLKPASEKVRVHTVSIVPPSTDTGGNLTLEIARGSDPAQNEATETWKLTILGEATRDLSTVLTVPTTSTASTGGISTAARTLSINTGFAVVPTAGTAISPAVAVLTNPSTVGVKRWSALEHTSIDPVVGEDRSFHPVPGSQGVLIK